MVKSLMKDEHNLMTVSQAKAREIMLGKNFFGIEEAQKHFDFTLSEQQTAYMAEVPFSEKTLRECKYSHALVAYIPISIVDIRTKTASVKLPEKDRMFYDEKWYDKNEVGNSVSPIGWHLILKTSVLDSESKTWSDQKGIVDAKNINCVPEACVMVYTIIGHFLETNIRLFNKGYVRTSTRDSEGDHVAVGDFYHRGLDVNCWRADESFKFLGVASARNPEACLS